MNEWHLTCLNRCGVITLVSLASFQSMAAEAAWAFAQHQLVLVDLQSVRYAACAPSSDTQSHYGHTAAVHSAASIQRFFIVL